MGLINMTAYPRSETGKNENRRLRVSGRTPAVIYGNDRETASNLEVKTDELHKVLKHAGRSPLFLLDIEGQDEACIAVLRDVQTHPVSDEIFHIDLMEIPQGVPVRIEVGLDIQGTNKFVRAGDGVLDVMRRMIEVECRPRQVPDSIVIDYSDLEINEKICVGDLSIENGVIITDPEEIILKVSVNLIADVDDEVSDESDDAEETTEETSSDASEATTGDKGKSD